MSADCPELLFAQYNYTPPIHFAVREGHADLVAYLLAQGAHDPSYRTYPFQDALETVADERGHAKIVALLQAYHSPRFLGDNGKIDFQRTALQREFEKCVDRNDLEYTALMLKDHPEFALDETYFWGEGILTFAAKHNHREMADLLMGYGAKVPKILKWAPQYYFERTDGATYMMEKGMDPNTMSWHHVTVLHDMARKGDVEKAQLLLDYGAEVNAIEEEYQSTPLGIAARWGNLEVAELLLAHGADPKRAGRTGPCRWFGRSNGDIAIWLIYFADIWEIAKFTPMTITNLLCWMMMKRPGRFGAVSF